MTRRNAPQPETTLAARVGDWLRSNERDAYPEVQFEPGKPIADWVAVIGQRASVIECKTTLSVKLLRQCAWWLDHAEWVTAAVPAPRSQQQREEREKCLILMERLDLGLIHVHLDDRTRHDSVSPEGIEIVLTPKAQQTGTGLKLITKLKPGHKLVGTAGSKEAGSRYTPFQQTMHHLRSYVAANPGCTLKEAVRHLDREKLHHYQTRQQAIQKILHVAESESGLPGMRWDTSDGAIGRLYLKGEEVGV